MSFVRDNVKSFAVAAFRAIVVAIGLLVVVLIGLMLFWQSPSFQASVSEAMKDNVPRGWLHAWACVWSACNPFKIIDPTNPKFEPTNFRFEDYPGYPYMRYAIGQIISPGMDRTRVEDILVKSGHAKTELYGEQPSSPESTGPEKVILYIHPRGILSERGSWIIEIKYDTDDRVESIRVNNESVGKSVQQEKKQ